MRYIYRGTLINLFDTISNPSSHAMSRAALLNGIAPVIMMSITLQFRYFWLEFLSAKRHKLIYRLALSQIPCVQLTWFISCWTRSQTVLVETGQFSRIFNYSLRVVSQLRRFACEREKGQHLRHLDGNNAVCSNAVPFLDDYWQLDIIVHNVKRYLEPFSVSPFYS